MALTPQQQALQNKIDVLDSSASTSTLLGLLVQSLDEGKIIWSYDSSGQIPVDSDYHGMIHFTHDSDKIRFVGTSSKVHLLDSQDTAPPGVQAGQNVQGTAYGYMTAGFAAPSTYYNTIDKFSFTSNANATDVGDTTSPGSVYEITASPTHTYIVGGYTSPGSNISSLEKYSMVSDGNSADTGTPTPAERSASTHNGPGFGYQIVASDIHKIVHTSDTFVDASGTIPSPIETSPAYKYQGYSSTTHAYSGNYNPTITNLDPFVKVAYASDTATASSAKGDETYGDQASAANFNSDVAGYAAGGNTRPSTNAVTAMTKFVFASEAEMTSVGTMAFAPADQRDLGRCASTTYGYAAGGQSYTAPNSGATTQNTIHNTPFASDANSSDVGDLTVARRDITPNQSQV